MPDVALFWSPEYHAPPARASGTCRAPSRSGSATGTSTRTACASSRRTSTCCWPTPSASRSCAPRAIDERRRVHAVDFDPAVHQRDWDAAPLYDAELRRQPQRRHPRRAQPLASPRSCTLPPSACASRRTRGVYGEAYGEILRRSRLGFNYSVAGGVNMRHFESPASGSLLMVERSNREIARLVHARRGVRALRRPTTSRSVVAHYLDHEDERRRDRRGRLAPRALTTRPTARMPRPGRAARGAASAPVAAAARRAPRPRRATGLQPAHMPVRTSGPYGDARGRCSRTPSRTAPRDAGAARQPGLPVLARTRCWPAGGTTRRCRRRDRVLRRAPSSADPADAVARFNRARAAARDAAHRGGRRRVPGDAAAPTSTPAPPSRTSDRLAAARDARRLHRSRGRGRRSRPGRAAGAS